MASRKPNVCPRPITGFFKPSDSKKPRSDSDQPQEQDCDNQSRIEPESTSCATDARSTLSDSPSPDSPISTIDPASSSQLDVITFSTDLCDLNKCPSTLSDSQKYHILTVVPTPLNKYPVNSQKRHFQSYWVEKYSWIRYSPSLDGVFCAPCFLFSRVRFNSEFISSPYHNWKNAAGPKGKLNCHAQSQSHKECLERAGRFIAVMDRKELSIRSHLSEEYDHQVQVNTRALLTIIDCIQFLVKQGLAFRGSHWDKDSQKENGNFSTLIGFLSEYSADLKSHMKSSARNARYLSLKIQNEFIAINGDIIRESIVKECNTSLFWSLMADETSDVSTTEQLSICVRYVQESNSQEIEVCEEFLGFCPLSTTSAEHITSAIVEFSNIHHLNMLKLVGKGFDGASNMSGHVSGVSTRLKQRYPNAKYLTHCRNHALNLAVVASCNAVLDIRHFMDTFKSLSLFFKYSTKRKHILSHHLQSSAQEDLLADISNATESDTDSIQHSGTRYRGLPVLSETRWLARVDSIDCFLRNYRAVCEAVEEVRTSSLGQSASDADSFLSRLLSFEFFVCAVICRHVLGFTRPLTVALQAKDCDLYEAHKMAQRLITTLTRERESENFLKLWESVIKISNNLNLQPEKKRTTRVQRNRANPPVEDIQSHYRVSYYYAFLDHTISHLKTRFPPELEGALLATHLLPSNCHKLTGEATEKIKAEFYNFLPQPSSFENEISSWKTHMEEAEICANHKNLLSTCNLANQHKTFYPNIHTILVLLLCLPVGSCSCERSFSMLRRPKTWCRGTMTGSRLDSLALGYINKTRTVTQKCSKFGTNLDTEELH